MFPPANLDPQSSKWVNAVQQVITNTEDAQPRLDAQLRSLKREDNHVLEFVSSQVNAYYKNTLSQYPVFERILPMSEVLDGVSKVLSISAPSDPNGTLQENWVTVFAKNVSMPVSKGVVGVRLNSVQFKVYGPSAYDLRYRWRVNGVSEGIATALWMNRSEFNLRSYPMSPSGTLTEVTNRYSHWSGTASDTVSLQLQVSIKSTTNPANAVTAQNVTFEARNNNGDETYLDATVTV